MVDDLTGADEIIEEVWEIRQQLWARLDNDPEKVIAYYLELEEQQDDAAVEPSSSDTKGNPQRKPPALVCRRGNPDA